ncbi:transposase [Clostridium sp. 'deep sea']|uniref:DUF6429 family protein n=1 Tax=Clostridium sp. 'deep sea' TaxID=2779445 RepID=UPI0018963F8C|nr:DUF6429 family protein [Clostridium sp. 'deep sea']QOR34849.1 transposase [Clostridium sp. 'deep sea']
MEDKVKELTLMLLYLTSWQENEYGFKYTRSWKGYNFNILDKLYEQDYIAGSKRAKSVGITEEGIEKARQLLKKYGIEE